MKRFNKISKDKAQRILFIALLVLIFGVFFISLSLLDPVETPPTGDKEPPIEIPDIEEKYETIVAPHKLTDIEVIRKFWTLEKETEDQEISLIVFGSSYHMSKGISYSANNTDFEVVASLSGVVKDITESSIYGKVVLIEHDNGIETEYMSLGEVFVEIDDEIIQGEVIGKSGINEFDVNAENHLHFRILIDGKYFDPEVLIGKAVNEIEEN
ncbi:MAG: M23 family metallopeptidase [Bacilli bacterium]|nr:M23 family metallopeptidase [Bacilli bacterium]